MQYNENAKVIPITPEILTEQKWRELVKKINEHRKDNYWLLTINPDGEIVIPKEQYRDHGIMLKDIIYPADMVLSMLFDYFYGESAHTQSINEIEMGNFAMYYGYMHCDGTIKGEDIDLTCRYNKKALTNKTQCVEYKFENYFSMFDSSNPKNVGDIEIKFSNKIPWMRNRIKRDYDEFMKDFDYYIKEMDSDSVLQIFLGYLNTTKREYLESIEKEYDSQQGNER